MHTARPDINCVAHSHSIYGRAFCSLGIPLSTITQDSCAFHDDLALYSSFRGIVLEAEEGIAIAEALENKKAALLQNHGLLTCGTTIESCVFWFTSLEKCCKSLSHTIQLQNELQPRQETNERMTRSRPTTS